MSSHAEWCNALRYGGGPCNCNGEPPLRAAEGYAACKRCGKPFKPKPTKLKTIPMTRCCETCQCKNFFDGLDLPTPPGLLDKHTKHPTLTDAEWRRELAKPDDTEAA